VTTPRESPGIISTRSGSHTCNAKPVEQQAHESCCSDPSLNPDPPFSSCQGRTYLCKRLDLGERLAVVRPADLKYYTKTRDFCDVHVIGGRALLPHNVRRSTACGAVRCRVPS
jgi:hypothetical protein